MRTIAVISQKGGAGKTTLAIHLAAEGASRGLRTLLIDLDPQASAARWADRRGDRAPDVSSEHPGRLVAALAAAKEQGYALAIVDTAPHADQAALTAARAADHVVVPCRPSILDLDAIGATIDLCQIARRPAVVVLNAARAGRPFRAKTYVSVLHAMLWREVGRVLHLGLAGAVVILCVYCTQSHPPR